MLQQSLPFSILSWGCGGGRLNREGLGVISKPDRQMGEGLIREGGLNKGLGVGGWGGANRAFLAYGQPL